MTSPPSSVLHGTGFFFNSTDTVSAGKSIRLTTDDSSEEKRTEAILRASGATWSALWIESPDGRRMPPERLRLAARWLRGEMNLEPVLWVFPSEKTIPETLSHLESCIHALTKEVSPGTVIKVILDIEVEYKGKKKLAQQFVDGLMAMKKRLAVVFIQVSFGFSSYPFGHSTLPWDTFAAAFNPITRQNLIDFVLPQLYESGDTDAEVNRSWTFYAGKFPGRQIIPVVASYIENTARLKKSLTCMQKKNPTALSVWVLRTTDLAEAQELGKFAFPGSSCPSAGK